MITTFDTIVEDKLKQIFEAVNEIPDFDQSSDRELSKKIIIAIHEKLFPKSSIDKTVLDQQFEDFFPGQTVEICRLLVNLEKPFLILQPDLIEKVGQIHPAKK